MILGLDVSTSRIGWAIINEKQELVDSDFFKTNNKTSLEERATALRDNVLKPIMALRRKDHSENNVLSTAFQWNGVSYGPPATRKATNPRRSHHGAF